MRQALVRGRHCLAKSIPRGLSKYLPLLFPQLCTPFAAQITASTKLITSFKGVTNSDRLWSLEKIVKGMQHEDIRVVAEAFLHFNLRDIFVIFSRQSGTELGLENVANGSQLVAASVEAGVIPLLVNILASSPGGAGMWAAIALQRLANDYRGEIATADGIVVLARAVQLVADHPAMLELPEVVESTLQACSAIARLNHRAASFVPAFVAAGAVPPVVALLLCPEGSGLIIRRAGVKAPSKKLPSPHPVAALAALLEGSTQAAAEAAFAASALPKLVTLWGLGLKYGSADSEGCIQVNEFAMQCFDALGVHFGAEVAAAKAEAGIVDPPPPPLSPAAEAGGPSDDVPTQAAAGIAEPAAVPPPPAPAALADEPSGDAPTAAVATTGTDAGGNSGELGC